MLKMALLDCASNEKCCSIDGRWGICPLFSSPPPPPGNLPSKAQKMLMPGDQLGGGGEGGRRWAQVELAGAVPFKLYM